MQKILPVLTLVLLLFIPASRSSGQDKTGEEKSKPVCGETQSSREKQGKYRGKPGDFFFKDADLQNVLIYFARTYKFNIVLDPGISGKVTCSLVQVPWDQALSVILRQHNLAMEQNGQVVRVINLKKLRSKDGDH